MSAKATWIRTLLLLYLAAGGAARAETRVRFEPANPTTSDSVNLIVTDYGPCAGRTWVLDRGRFPMSLFGRIIPGLSCPGGWGVTTRTVSLGSFGSGRHRIVGYVLSSSDSGEDSLVENWEAAFDELLTVEHRGSTELSWRFFNGQPREGTVFELSISGEWPSTCKPDFKIRRNGYDLALELFPRTDDECEPFLERVERRRLQPPLEAGTYELTMDLSGIELSTSRSVVISPPRRFVVRKANQIELDWILFPPAYPKVVELQPSERQIRGSRHGECPPVAANVEVHDLEVKIDLDQPISCPIGTPDRFSVTFDLLGLRAGRYNLIVSIGSRFLHEEEFLVLPERPRASLWHRRFLVDIGWQDHQGRTGKATPVEGPDPRSQSFWFFSQSNTEMLLKILDGCSVNGSYWVFASAATDVAYDLRVFDTFTGNSKTYSNPLGKASPAVTDVSTFACAE